MKTDAEAKAMTDDIGILEKKKATTSQKNETTLQRKCYVAV